MRKTKNVKRRIVKRVSTEVIVFPSRARILQRDWVHSSTEDVNREIVRLRRAQGDAEDDVVRLRAEIAKRQKVATQAKNDANALEALVETRK